jgi:hypothetical protein
VNVSVDKNHPIKCSGVDYVQQTLSRKFSYQMTTIETKQNELDAKVVSMLDSQQVQTQAFNDIKSMFSTFLRGQKEHTNNFLSKPQFAFEVQP